MSISLIGISLLSVLIFGNFNQLLLKPMEPRSEEPPKRLVFILMGTGESSQGQPRVSVTGSKGSCFQTQHLERLMGVASQWKLGKAGKLFQKEACQRLGSKGSGSAQGHASSAPISQVGGFSRVGGGSGLNAPPSRAAVFWVSMSPFPSLSSASFYLNSLSLSCPGGGDT